MASIYFNEEHILLQKMVREFSKNELAPLAQEIDKNETFPLESIKKNISTRINGDPMGN